MTTGGKIEPQSCPRAPPLSQLGEDTRGALGTVAPSPFLSPCDYLLGVEI